MAIQEKEFVAKNGVDVKNAVLKLSGTQHGPRQFPISTDGSSLSWREIKSGQGILVSYPDASTLLVATSGTLPGDLKAVGDLTVGGSAIWAANGSTTVTVTLTAHGLITGNYVYLAWFASSGAKPTDGFFTVTLVDVNTFTVTNGTTVAVGAVSPTAFVGGNVDIKRNLTIGQTLSVTGVASVGTSLTVTGTPSILAATTGNTASVFNTTTGTVNLGQSSNAISIGSASSNVAFGNTITHKGITLQAGAASAQKVDTVYSFTTTSIALGVAWQDSGISGSSQLMTGVYNFRIQVDGSNEFYQGSLPWYSGNGSSTLSDEFTEVVMAKLGDGATASSVYMRILRVASGAPKIQLAASSSLASQTYTFTFRKLID